jgi:hypothetical protein
MVFSCGFNADVFIRFLTRLLKSTDGRTMILVVDSHPAHKALRVARWIEAKLGRRVKLELSLMPGYSQISIQMSWSTRTPSRPCGGKDSAISRR